MRSPSGRASILKNGLALHDFPPLKESCLIWWMTVRQCWRPATGTSCGQSPAILKEKRYHTGWSNFASSPAPVARSDLTWISARSLGTTAPGSACPHCARPSPADPDRTTHRIDHARELGEEAVAGVLYDPPPVLLDFGLNELPEMLLEPFMRPLLIHPHQA